MTHRMALFDVLLWDLALWPSVTSPRIENRPETRVPGCDWSSQKHPMIVRRHSHRHRADQQFLFFTVLVQPGALLLCRLHLPMQVATNYDESSMSLTVAARKFSTSLHRC